MSDVIRAADAPMIFEVEAGKTYFWCACGRSKKQPLCDGSHKDTDISPLRFEATETKQVYFCMCKASAKAPLCDGTHSRT